MQWMRRSQWTQCHAQKIRLPLHNGLVIVSRTCQILFCHISTFGILIGKLRNDGVAHYPRVPETVQKFVRTNTGRIMLNEIFRFVKKEKPVSLDEIEVEQGKEDAYENIDLKRALDAMSKEDKAVIELKYFEDMKLIEIAEVLGENVNTVKSRLYRSLKKLRLELTDVWQ